MSVTLFACDLCGLKFLVEGTCETIPKFHWSEHSACAGGCPDGVESRGNFLFNDETKIGDFIAKGRKDWFWSDMTADEIMYDSVGKRIEMPEWIKGAIRADS